MGKMKKITKDDSIEDDTNKKRICTSCQRYTERIGYCNLAHGQKFYGIYRKVKRPDETACNWFIGVKKVRVNAKPIAS